MRVGAAELLHRHLLARHGADDVGPGDEHVRRAPHHHDEVRDRRRVDGAACARAHHQRDLRHDPGGVDVALEDLRVAGEGDDALLDPRAPRVVDPDDRTAVGEGEIHDLADLARERLAERSTEDAEVLREGEHATAVDEPVAGHDAVPVGPPVEHPEVRVDVADEAVELAERPRVEEGLDPLVSRPLAPLALPLERGRVAVVGGAAPRLQVGQAGRGAVRARVRGRRHRGHPTGGASDRPFRRSAGRAGPLSPSRTRACA